MNKLLTSFTGGMPDFLDNFRWHEEAVKDALAHIVKGMADGKEALKLYGAQVSQNPSNYLVAGGAIFFAGEIFSVFPHTLQKLPTGVPGTYYWDFEESYAPEGELLFENGSMANCYAIRTARLKKTTEVLEEGSYVPFEVPSFSDVYTKRSVFDALQSNFAALSATFSAIQAQVGGAYFKVALSFASELWTVLSWDVAVGALKSETSDLKMVNGGVYEIYVHRLSNAGSLRLYKLDMESGAFNIDYNLYKGLNVVHINGFSGTHDVAIEAKNNDDLTELTIKLIALDTNPSEGGPDIVITNPELGG